MSEEFEKYKDTINGVYRQTKENLWTMPFATLVLLLFAVLFITIVLNLVFLSFGFGLAFLVYTVEIAVPLLVLYLHQRKVYETVREKIQEMDATQPGIYAAYEEWRSHIDSPSA
jgi:ABC-type transport system involved in cytochrome c biogenesis permease subunit